MKKIVLIRKSHYWVAGVIALPLIITLITGALLILRHQFEYIQPGKIKTGHSEINVSYEKIIDIIGDISIEKKDEMGEVSKIIIMPSNGLIAVRLKNDYEVQIDGKTGDILKVSPRRTGFLIDLHEGVFFGEWVRKWVFTPMVFLVVGLWISGVILFITIFKQRIR